jgi:hypothetical protein
MKLAFAAILADATRANGGFTCVFTIKMIGKNLYRIIFAVRRLAEKVEQTENILIALAELCRKITISLLNAPRRNSASHQRTAQSRVLQTSNTDQKSVLSTLLP